MTRIISGQAGSITLEVPATGTRPTSDRVRESLFSALEAADAIEDASVLDLYAGSGALGLEAASRGASSVDLVERSTPAAAVARRNASKVLGAVSGACTVQVHAASVVMYLQRLAAAHPPFDLVFIDPPYDISEHDLSESLALLAPVLAPGAIVIVERAGRSPEPALPSSLSHLRNKRYGDTALWWIGPAE